MLYRTLLKMSFLPPLLNVLLILIGLLLLRRYRKTGLLFCLSGLGSLYLLSTPIVANHLADSVQVTPVVSMDAINSLDNAAIVVLGAGHTDNRREYAGPWPNDNAIARLNYAARLHRLTEHPLLLTGGQPGYSDHIHAQVMADYLWQQFFIRAKWLEKRSRTTEENASYSRDILVGNAIDTVILVTHAKHMRRAILLFERENLKVIPAPTYFAEGAPNGIRGWLPETARLHQSAQTIHEIIGYWWYRFAVGS